MNNERITYRGAIVPDNLPNEDLSEASIQHTRFFVNSVRQADKGVHFFTHYSRLFDPVLMGDTEQWVFARSEACRELQQRCGNPDVHFIPLEMDHLYLFTNVGLNNGDERQGTVVNVEKNHNVLKTAVDAYHVSSGLFTKDDPVNVMLVRIGHSGTTEDSCMFFFRLFHLSKYSGEPFYSMIYTGHLVFDAYVGYDLGRWSVETPRVTMLYYDNRHGGNAGQRNPRDEFVAFKEKANPLGYVEIN
ncbi:hypothetical protein WA577_000470 [Blastocystis sp. JDR]